eukprot:CAMPEP_0201956600 /NCGR_PEP_ID=MMETSP0904-20121228/4036_1 /ASSEMBLY_ACC=CAM_ASM_000553 /TAXON_ID=420261 /ORGANISM="Thalassiosira antarctica, Strain CCMP982" /LENGTH=64 /DNA_ID=CAMNT_0048501223 /DNA_START=148 /DNA_END=342 /DNA_ORIENTATION=+
MTGAVELIKLALALEGGITGTRAWKKAAAVILFDDEKTRSMECDVTSRWIPQKTKRGSNSDEGE